MSLMMFHTQGPLEKRALGKLSGTGSCRSRLPRGKGVARCDGNYSLDCAPGEGTCGCRSPRSGLSTVCALDSLLSPVWNPYLAFPASSVPHPQMRQRLATGLKKAHNQAWQQWYPPLSLQQCPLLSAELWEEGHRASPPPPRIAHCWGSAARG